MNENDALRTYRAANEALDERPGEDARAAILAAAARAVEAKPRAVDRVRHWRVPLAAAATVLVSTIAVLVATRTEQEAAKLASALPEATTRESTDIYTAPAEPTAATPAPAAPVPTTPARSANDTTPAPIAEAPRAEVPRAAKPVPAPAEKSEAPTIAAAPAAPRSAVDAVASSEARAERGAASGEVAGLHAARERAPSAPATTELAPAQWIERIVKLREAGRDEEADRELKRLRERYPQLHVPPAALRKPIPATGK